MPKRCTVGGCSNISDQNYSLHLFPRTEKYSLAWTKFIQTTRLDFDAPSKHSAICSAHFKEECFSPVFGWLKEYGKPRQRRLREGSVPTIKSSIEHKPEGSGSTSKHRKFNVVREALGLENTMKRAPYVIQCLALLHHDYLLPMTTTLKNRLLYGSRDSKSDSSCKSRNRNLKQTCGEKLKQKRRKKKKKLTLVDGGTKNGGVERSDENFNTEAQSCAEQSEQSSERRNKRGRKVLLDVGQSDQSSDRPKKQRRRVVSSAEHSGQSNDRRKKRRNKILISPGYPEQSIGKRNKRGKKILIESSPVSQNQDESPWIGQGEQIDEKLVEDAKGIESTPVGQNNVESPLLVKEEPIWDERLHQDIGNADQKESLLTVNHIVNDRTLVIKKEPSCNEEESINTFNEDAYSKRMTQSMYSMQKSEALCDFTILVENEDTERHIPVLVHRLAFSFASNSIVFREGVMLDASRHMNRCVASNIIEFVYTGKISELSSFSHEKIEKLKSAARFLQIPDCLSCLERHNSLERSTMSLSHSHDAALEWLCTTPDLMPPSFVTGQSSNAKSFNIDGLESVSGDSTTDTSDNEVP